MRLIPTDRPDAALIAAESKLRLLWGHLDRGDRVSEEWLKGAFEVCEAVITRTSVHGLVGLRSKARVYRLAHERQAKVRLAEIRARRGAVQSNDHLDYGWLLRGLGKSLADDLARLGDDSGQIPDDEGSEPDIEREMAEWASEDASRGE